MQKMQLNSRDNRDSDSDPDFAGEIEVQIGLNIST